jgi:hypothetical protein
LYGCKNFHIFFIRNKKYIYGDSPLVNKKNEIAFHWGLEKNIYSVPGILVRSFTQLAVFLGKIFIEGSGNSVQAAA